MEKRIIKLPIVRLIGRKVFKVLYGGKKWVFEQGIEYKDVHPSFSAHLSTLKDSNNKPLFKIECEVEIVKATTEQSIEAVRKADNLGSKIKKRSVQLKEGKVRQRRRPPKLNTA